MALKLHGRNAVFARPDVAAPIVEGNAWAKDRSAPGAADGYELTAGDVNEIVGQLRYLLTALGGDLEGADGNELAAAMTAALNAKLTIADGLGGLDDAGGFVRMTDAERAKLAALNEGYKGAYASLSALVTAWPTGVAGDWAILTKGTGDDASVAVWDSDNTPAGWVDTEVGPATIDWAAVTSKPTTFPPDAHSHPTSQVTGLDAIIAALLRRDVTAAIAVGFTSTPVDKGTISSGTFTPNIAEQNRQCYTNGGAHTLAAPAADGDVDVWIFNGASAGAITFSGFTVASGNTGDALTTTNTHVFIVSVRRVKGVSTYLIKALQ